MHERNPTREESRLWRRGVIFDVVAFCVVLIICCGFPTRVEVIW